MRAFIFALLLVASCATPAILLEPKAPEPCPSWQEDTALPTSGKVHCQNKQPPGMLVTDPW